ncbi:hypothetical protein TNIN_168621 [Trichonephila inaurata madagascariensis]|uniref:Secreted protein n=1 Tax=Trichonephila inaurata madagascariensis TaxID=2747483 RepID=A0A8X6YS68_9ARAC|nr:hypothetical protein TNIN_168621 [Trichonephila inaurata madagascariensis]
MTNIMRILMVLGFIRSNLTSIANRFFITSHQTQITACSNETTVNSGINPIISKHYFWLSDSALKRNSFNSNNYVMPDYDSIVESFGVVLVHAPKSHRAFISLP